MDRVSKEFLKARQLTFYFQHYKELPHVKKKPVPASDSQDEEPHGPRYGSAADP